MALISKKKIAYPISAHLRSYLKKYRKEIYLPITYQDLLRYNNSIPLYDSKGVDTLWETVFFPQDEMQEIHFALKTIYAIMQSGGDVSVMKHLFVDRIDLCIYGNTKPFRIRIVIKLMTILTIFILNMLTPQGCMVWSWKTYWPPTE